MKEKPILMSTINIPPIFDGRKTQTRRVIKSQPKPDPWSIERLSSNIWMPTSRSGKVSIFHPSKIKCPYEIGMYLWVRETFMEITGYPRNRIVYKADNPDLTLYPEGKWKSPYYMPRAASRINLEITNIRAQRIQGISEEDSRAEGATPSVVGVYLDNMKYRAGFQTLWNSINEKCGHGFDVNDWVWALTFKMKG